MTDFLKLLFTIAFSTLLFIPSTHAQNPTEGDTIWFRGKKVILKKDYTWQFVEIKPIPTPKQTTVQESEKQVVKQEKTKDKSEVSTSFSCDSVFRSRWETNRIISFRDLGANHDFPEKVSVGKAVIPVAGRVYRGVSGGHKGMDVSLRLGDTVLAAFSGKVRHATFNSGGFGNLVIIRHCNGLETYYAHLSKILVDVNDEVKEGQVIGLGGSTGRSVSPHLHFEMRYLDRILNPLEVFDFINGTIVGNKISIPEGGYSPSYVFNTPPNSDVSNNQDKDDSEPEIVTPTKTETTTPKNQGSSTPKKTVPKKTEAKPKAKYHTVTKGETLSSIARKYGTTVEKISKLNGLGKSTKINIGKKLRVN